MQDDDVAEFCALIIRDIKNGDIHQSTRKVLTRCKLLGFEKPDSSGIRPIAIGEVLLKVACTMVLHEISDALTSQFHGIQLGIRTPNGCEMDLIGRI